MRRLLIPLALLLALALPAWADLHEEEPYEGYRTVAMGEGWYQVVMNVVTLAPGGRREIYISLDDVPGPLMSTPALYAKALSEGANQADFVLWSRSFAPGLPGGYTAHVIVTLWNLSGGEERYRVKAIVKVWE